MITIKFWPISSCLNSNLHSKDRYYFVCYFDTGVKITVWITPRQGRTNITANDSLEYGCICSIFNDNTRIPRIHLSPLENLNTLYEYLRRVYFSSVDYRKANEILTAGSRESNQIVLGACMPAKSRSCPVVSNCDVFDGVSPSEIKCALHMINTRTLLLAQGVLPHASKLFETLSTKG